ncbi:MAG: CRISPR-associated protein Cas4 [Spirochaetia bacterium]|jgi:CRISPR-associated exonuclease Cas4|nr:CRISPR-associated protein Cas4 [Spirochaetia bacterium]
MYSEDDFLQLSGIQHYLFCKRQWCLIHIEKLWTENYLTTSGMLFHERAHDKSVHELRGDVLTIRDLDIASTSLGISGKCDVVEFHRTTVKNGVALPGYEGSWQVVPVEYKRGRQKINDADRYQVVAQALCLEEMFSCQVPICYLYYGQTRKREEIKVACFRERVELCFEEMHAMYTKGETVRSPQTKSCSACSLYDYCLPSFAKKKVKVYLQKELSEDGLS